jgi:hypothetical protein
VTWLSAWGFPFHRAFKAWTGLTLGAYWQAHNEPTEHEALS